MRNFVSKLSGSIKISLRPMLSNTWFSLHTIHNSYDESYRLSIGKFPEWIERSFFSIENSIRTKLFQISLIIGGSKTYIFSSTTVIRIFFFCTLFDKSSKNWCKFSPCKRTLSRNATWIYNFCIQCPLQCFRACHSKGLSSQCCWSKEDSKDSLFHELVSVENKKYNYAASFAIR